MSDKVYCMYCGVSEHSISQLTFGTCTKNPDGNNHALYDSREKDKYTCKYCGSQDVTIVGLTQSLCSKSPTKNHIPSIN